MEIIIGMFVLLVFFTACLSSSMMSKTELKFSDKADELYFKGLDAESPKEVEKYLDKYNDAYDTAQSSTVLKHDQYYLHQMDELREYRDDLKREEWENKADEILKKFMEVYQMIIDPQFSDVDKAYKSKNKCIALWESYYASRPDDLEINTEEYIRYFFEEDFEDCMLRRDALEARLDACILKMRPEYKRKMKLRKDIVDKVAQNESILRSKLLQTEFAHATEKEIQYCYRDLLKKNTLIEIKLGSRYFVYLTDKEKEKREKQEQKKTMSKSDEKEQS